MLRLTWAWESNVSSFRGKTHLPYEICVHGMFSVCLFSQRDAGISSTARVASAFYLLESARVNLMQATRLLSNLQFD